METELKAIVGIKIPIEKVEGKMKFNQNRTAEDQRGVVDHLIESGGPMQQEVAGIMNHHLCPHLKKEKHD